MSPPSLARGESTLVLLTNDAIRARRRPAAIVMLWAFEALVAAACVWPVSSYVGSLYGSGPVGDAPLFRASGLALGELVLRSHHMTAPWAAHLVLVVSAAMILGLVPLGAVFVSVSFATRERKAPPLPLALARGWFALPRLASLLVLATLAQAFLAIGGLLAAAAFAQGLAERLGDARADRVAIFALAAFGAALALVGVVHDLASAAALRFDVAVLPALRIGATTFRRAPLAAFVSWAGRAAAGGLAVATSAVVSAKLGYREGAAFLALAALHQLTVLARVALRSSWLAKAVRMVDASHRVVTALPAKASAAR